MERIVLIGPTHTCSGATVVLLNIIDTFYLTNKLTVVLPPFEGWIYDILIKEYPHVEILVNPYFTFGWCGHTNDVLTQKEYKLSELFLCNNINLEEVSLIISNSMLSFDGVVLSARNKIKHIWVIHETLTKEFWSRNLQIDVLNYYFGLSDEIITVNDLPELIHQNKKVIPNAEINPLKIRIYDKSPDEIQYDEPQYINIGTICERKNQWLLLEALSPNEITFFTDKTIDIDYANSCPVPYSSLNIKTTFNTLSAIKNSCCLIHSAILETGPLVSLEAAYVGKPCLNFVSSTASEKLLLNNYYYKANPQFLWSTISELKAILKSNMEINPMNIEQTLCNYLKNLPLRGTK